MMQVAPHFLWSMGLSLVLPIIGGQAVPMRIKLMFAIALGLLLASLMAEPSNVIKPWNLTDLPRLIFHFVAGVVVGFVLRVIYSVFEMVGAIISNAMSMMQLTAGQDTSQSSVYSNVSAVFAGFAFLTAGGHLWLLSRVLRHYPDLHLGLIGGASETDLLHEISVRVPDVFSAVFLTGFALAMPFLVFTLIYYLTLGVVNRLFPQFMVIIVGAPALILGGMILILAFLPFAFDVPSVLLRVIEEVNLVPR